MVFDEREVDVCIIGAGPHGLAAALHLHDADPDLDVITLDEGGGWMSMWRRQFDQLEIEMLRSPVVHHPGPDPAALAWHIHDRGLPQSDQEYQQPIAEAFIDFCDTAIAAAGLAPPVAAEPHRLDSDGHSISITTAAQTVRARHLVIASNPHRRTIPDWAWHLLGHRPGLVSFGLDVDLRGIGDLTGQCVVIVGGGLTAAHLACGAAERGATVELVSRQPLRISDFDVHPGWHGPKYLRRFEREADPVERLNLARRARSGGSIPAWMCARLLELSSEGRLTLHEGASVVHATPDPSAGCLLEVTAGTRLTANEVWLATGTVPDLRSLRCVRPLLDDLTTFAGFPLVDDSLRLGPHPAYVMGRVAMGTLGPAAGNLWGARQAARRITRAITGADIDGGDVALLPTRHG